MGCWKAVDSKKWHGEQACPKNIFDKLDAGDIRIDLWIAQTAGFKSGIQMDAYTYDHGPERKMIPAPYFRCCRQ